MLNYNEMVKCEQEYARNEKQMLTAKYTAFSNYIKKVINIAFKDNEEQIISYLKETGNQVFLLDWCVGGIHYVGFHINILDDKVLNVSAVRAHDSYYDPILNFEANIKNEDLLSFFDREYKYFVNLFIPSYDYKEVYSKPIDESHSVIYKLVDKFNDVFYDHFKEHFHSFGINDIRSFVESKYSLSFTDERRHELDEEVYKEYESYSNEVNEITKKFNESVKDLK